ncbi:MAG: universal stress protein [Polyangiaceae bacterium]|nr:universal stress protein [Polyangiaceae bacterium]
MQAFRKILVPTDFGPPARQALDLACEIADKFDSTVTILHVYTPPVVPYMEPFPFPLDDFMTAAQVVLDREVARARTMHKRVSGELGGGAAWREIVDRVVDEGHDLVVMGTHGRRGVSRVLVGSVADRVVRTCPVPVLTVSGPDLGEHKRSAAAIPVESRPR